MSTLTELIDAVAAELKDPDHDTWSADELGAQIASALTVYSRYNPRRADSVLTPDAGEREVDISALSGRLDLIDVWYPYDPAEADANAYPPPRPAWRLLDRDTLYLQTDSAPTGASEGSLRLFYTLPHAISGLEGASETTLDAEGEELIVLLASARAAMQLAQATIGTVTVSRWTPQDLQNWASARQRCADAALEALRRRLALRGDARVAWG